MSLWDYTVVAEIPMWVRSNDFGDCKEDGKELFYSLYKYIGQQPEVIEFVAYNELEIRHPDVVKECMEKLTEYMSNFDASDREEEKKLFLSEMEVEILKMKHFLSM